VRNGEYCEKQIEELKGNRNIASHSEFSSFRVITSFDSLQILINIKVLETRSVVATYTRLDHFGVFCVLLQRSLFPGP